MLVSDLYCPSCRNAKDHKPQDNEVCWSCVAMGGAGNYKESKTNYDRVHAMNLEEFAQWLCDVAGWLPTFEGRVHPVLEWLKQEADDDGN